LRREPEDETNYALCGKLTTGSSGRRVAPPLKRSVDAGDAVRRRRMADRIYEDLIAERIGIARAILDL
jgi:hypothetical protein